MTGYRAITRARKIVFWLLAALFVVTWPFLVLYALGIVISPTAEHPVVETGVIRVESHPAGARFYLNGEDTAKVTPAAVERLRAGTYRVSLRKPGYLEWNARVTVDVQAVRRVNSAVLVPRLAKVHLVSVGSYDSERMSANSQYLLFSGKRVDRLRFFDLKTQRFLPEVPAMTPYLSDEVVRVSQQPWGNIVLVQVDHLGASTVLVLHESALGLDLEHVIDAAFFQDVSFAWSPSLSGAVYFLKDGTLRRMDTWNALDNERLTGSVLAVGIANNALYYIDASGAFGQISPFGHRHELFSVPQGVRDGLRAGGSIRFVGDGWGAALAPSGELFLFRSGRFARYDGVRGLAVDRARERFVVWTDFRIGSLPFPGATGEILKRIDWIPGAPNGKTISSVTSAAGDSNCVYVSDGAVWVEPILPGVVGEPQRVLVLAPGESCLYSESSGLLLVTDQTIGRMRVIHFITHSLIPSLE